MAYRGSQTSSRRTWGEMDVIYSHFPGVSTAITAVPKGQWDDKKETYECVKEMVLTRFEQLPEAQQGKLLAMCNDLIPTP